jgi:TM2 domain-containing membrane protein YozV
MGPPPGAQGPGWGPQQAPGWHPQQGPPAWNQNAMVPWDAAQQAPEIKSPTAAAALSAFFPGAGQLYNGQVGKGLALFFAFMACVPLFPLALIPYFWSIMDAYSTSRRINVAGYLPP